MATKHFQWFKAFRYVIHPTVVPWMTFGQTNCAQHQTLQKAEALHTVSSIL